MRTIPRVHSLHAIPEGWNGTLGAGQANVSPARSPPAECKRIP